MSEARFTPSENELPFKISEAELLSDKGSESDVFALEVESTDKLRKRIILKESRLVELADDEEMQKQKKFYEALKYHPNFGKFVTDTSFVKARKNSKDNAHNYKVQKSIKGVRVDQLSDADINKDKELVKELIEFINASIEVLEGYKEDPAKKPDFYADTRKFLGNFLNNPRYSGNILVSGKEENLSTRIHFVDASPILRLALPKYPKINKILEPFNLRAQILQLKRWKSKLEKNI